jgi:hypothetical protein
MKRPSSLIFNILSSLFGLRRNKMIGAHLANGRTAEIYAWGNDHVVKLYRTGFADASDWELGQVQAVHAAGVNTPAATEKVVVNGRSGIIFERVTGETMVTSLLANPQNLLNLAQQLADLQVAMHQHVATGLPQQTDQLRRKIKRVPQLTDEEKTAVLHHLDQLPQGSIVCHGDFHPDNVMLTPNGPIIIDWIDATIGHPAADIARTQSLLTVGDLPPSVPPAQREQIYHMRQTFYAIYKERILETTSITAADINAWLIPTAAARLLENIPGTEAQLLHIARSA